MIIQVPLYLLLAVALAAMFVIILLGAVLHRKSSGAPYVGGPIVGPLLYGSKLEAVQPKNSPPISRRFGLLRKKQPQFIDPETQERCDYLGKVNFSLSYDKESHTLIVHIIEAVQLQAKDLNGFSDPYIRVVLLPDHTTIQRTKVIRKNLNPQFNQSLKFPGHSMRKLSDMQLCMQVMDYDRFSSDDPIGEILLPMKNVKFENQPVYWKHLKKPTVHQETKGELMLSLCYLPGSNMITVVVIKAKELPTKDVIGSSDPYIKLWLVQQGAKLEKRKTTVKQQSLSPVYNESFAFNVPDKQHLTSDVNLVATVMDYDLVGSNDEIGHVVIGPLGGDVGARHWHNMIESPEKPVATWHKLVPRW